jgi:hypothetical protein
MFSRSPKIAALLMIAAIIGLWVWYGVTRECVVEVHGPIGGTPASVPCDRVR